MIPGVVSNAERHANMAIAMATGYQILKRRGSFHGNRISIVGYGPSLRATWKQVPRPIMTVSGAHDFMIDRDVFPDFHVECDPREHKPRMMGRARPKVRYLMATCCHPSWWPKLDSYDVKLWHLINGDDGETLEWIRKNDSANESNAIGGGSTVGLRAMNVAAALGYRKFDIFGMDGSFETDRHASHHSGQPEPHIWVKAGSGKYRTTPQLAQQAIEMRRFLETIDAEVHFHGSGLIPAMASMIGNNRKVAA